ncbi:MAG: hypothetical protein ACC742_09770 [Thermoanaerobaculales bacterium]
MRAAILVLTVLFQASTLLADSGDKLRLDLQSVNLRRPPDPDFELGLTADSAGRFRLFEDATPPPATERSSDTPTAGLRHTLRSDDQHAPSSLEELELELVERRLRLGAARRHMGLEQQRVYDGGPTGPATSQALMLDPAGWANLFGRLRGALRKKAPPGARVPLEHDLTLVVRETDGNPPGEIVVLPMALGYVGNPVHASCDPAGRCQVAALPSEPSTLLVRGRGAAIVTVGRNDPGALVTLRPTGVLRFDPTGSAEDGAWRVRVTDLESGAPVPVIRWQNPDRGPWTPVPRTGLVLLLPAGSYKVESAAPARPKCAVEIKVDVDEVTKYLLPPVACR